ncbi:type I pantothenate kinase [Streptomyces sp. DSM 44915]|uniref:Pantothenate kinase n=1 Tax=Streptomyces chisholmiae TaxID=3075540 RepID=A0ABU2JUB2_9ACTN|nr:type I pantothenate kinase [Streptomyces sp. DSM 44915]MDT0267788.1 type I pantothenate kinase [Streptomyces sp. DSM 44915]
MATSPPEHGQRPDRPHPAGQPDQPTKSDQPDQPPKPARPARTGRPQRPSPYVDLSRADWVKPRDGAPNPLTAEQVERLRGLGDVIDLAEVRDIYLPLCELLRLHIDAARQLRGRVGGFLGGPQPATPFVIGIAGSVAVGKSTVARLLRALLAQGPEEYRVALVPTDGFLLPNAELERRGLMRRKGFPESYDRRALTRFVAEVKSGRAEVRAPVYSHLVYDIVPGEQETVRRPDILILEGLNVLQPAPPGRIGVADYFDFSVYVDARTTDIESWYLTRFQALRATAFRDPRSFFRRYAELSEEEALDFARTTWRTVNGPNLVDNIAPTRGRASLVLRKGADHAVHGLRLRKL